MAASGVTPDVNTNGFTSSNKVLNQLSGQRADGALPPQARGAAQAEHVGNQDLRVAK